MGFGRGELTGGRYAASVNIIPSLSAIASPAEFRSKVLRLEDVMRGMQQADCPVRNIFADGLYVREMTIPKGCTLTGFEHKTRHLNLVARGRIAVWTERGMREITGPYLFESMPGTKRVGHALEETVWMTFHRNPDNCRDEKTLVERLTTGKYEDLLGVWNKPRLQQGEQKCRLEQ